MKNKISVLGCGWLGTPLAIKLIGKGFTVNGATTSKSKLKDLQKENIEPYLIKVNPDFIDGDIKDFLNSDILIINIPPSNGMDQPQNYNKLLKEIELSPINKVIFISTTSAYKELTGTLTEEDALPNNKFVQIESLFLDNLIFNTTVIRFGGLISEDRNPVKYFAGRKNIEGGNAPVNLINRDDCINSIIQIINQNCWNQVFNAVSDDHPVKSEYYTKMAKKLNLEIPQFDDDKSTDYKVVSNEKIKSVLDFNFTGIFKN